MYMSPALKKVCLETNKAVVSVQTKALSQNQRTIFLFCLLFHSLLRGGRGWGWRDITGHCMKM